MFQHSMLDMQTVHDSVLAFEIEMYVVSDNMIINFHIK